MSSTRRPNPRGNLIFKDVTSDGDDCDSHVDEGEQDEEGKDASGEAHKRDKRQRRSRGVRMCVSWSVPDAEQRLQGCRSKLDDRPVGSPACPCAVGEVLAGSLAG